MAAGRHQRSQGRQAGGASALQHPSASRDTGSESIWSRPSRAPRRSCRRSAKRATSRANGSCCRAPTSRVRCCRRSSAKPAPRLPRSWRIRTVLAEIEREGDPDIYRMLLEKRIDVVTFTSASTVKNFVQIFGAEQSSDSAERDNGRVDRPGHCRGGRAVRHQNGHHAQGIHDSCAGAGHRRPFQTADLKVGTAAVVVLSTEVVERSRGQRRRTVVN